MIVWRLLDAHALFVSFLLLLLEESGLPPLVPGDALMVLAGVRAAGGRESLVQVLAVLEVATVLGGSLLYWVSARWGPAALARIGRLVGAPPARLARGSRWLERHGQRVIVVGRLIPGLAILTTVAAGVLGIPYRRFVSALALGSLLRIVVFVMLGYWIGPPMLRLLTRHHPSATLVVSLIVLAALAVALARGAHRKVTA
jgi:membrane-associated protein